MYNKFTLFLLLILLSLTEMQAQFDPVPPRDNVSALELILILTGHELPTVDDGFTDAIVAVDASDPTIMLGDGLTGDNGAGLHIAGLYSNPPASGKISLIYYDKSTMLYHYIADAAGAILKIDFTESSVQAGIIEGYEDATSSAGPYPGNANLGPGFATFDEAQAALPVTFSSFSGLAKGGANFLEWTTETESENNYFSVERSSDGASFEEIGQVDGAGNSSVETRYEFTDASLGSGNNYYRLRQVDFSGTYTYSSVLLLNNVPGDGIEMSVFPNPATNNIVVSLNGTWSNDFAKVIMTDVSGRLVMEWQQTVASAKTVSVSDIPAGVYQINVTDKQRHISRKLVVGGR